MTRALLLDEMLSAMIAAPLCDQGQDVIAVVADPLLIGLSDEDVLIRATVTDRAVVTQNIGDLIRLDRDWKAADRRHGGIVLVPSRTFPRDGRFIGSLGRALKTLLERDDGGVGLDSVVYLSADPPRPSIG